VEVPVDVGDATSAVHGLWSAVPSAVRKREDIADLLDGFAVPGFSRLACNEPAFHYLLDIERRRSEMTQRPFLVMLIECHQAPDRVFSIVGRSVRETDFVGWYRQNMIVGVTLTQDGRSGTAEASGIVRGRIVDALHRHFPSHVPELRLRLYEILGSAELRID